MAPVELDDAHLEHLIQLNARLDRMMDGIVGLKEKQEEMAEGISKIGDAVYDPEQGLYARLRDLESWQKTVNKLVWGLGMGVGGLVIKTIWEAVLLST